MDPYKITNSSQPGWFARFIGFVTGTPPRVHPATPDPYADIKESARQGKIEYDRSVAAGKRAYDRDVALGKAAQARAVAEYKAQAKQNAREWKQRGKALRRRGIY
jgi:hypothetical protein